MQETDLQTKAGRPRVALVGATGAVGRELLGLLAERDFPFSELTLWSSERSAGTKIPFRDGELTVRALPDDGGLDADLIFASASSGISREHAFRWAEHGAAVIDNSSAWRMDERVPLVIPEVNPEAVRGHPGVIANPNCSTIIALMALAPLHRAFGLKRSTIATYQAVSGAGAAGVTELEEQSRAVLGGAEPVTDVFRHIIAFNLFSHDSDIGDDGYNEEERKLLEESRKILSAPELAVSATCVRVPVFRAHSEAIHAEFSRPVSPAEALAVFREAPGLTVVDDPDSNTFPMPLSASGRDDILVGRVREDSSRPGALAFFVSGDQVRKGAALNAVQIGELLVS